LKKSFERLKEQKEALKVGLYQEDCKVTLAHLAAQLATLMKHFYSSIGNSLVGQTVEGCSRIIYQLKSSYEHSTSSDMSFSYLVTGPAW